MQTPDLTGSTIVLMHPRTGSSLVMQTLRLLGVEVVGDVHRSGFPVEANPKGYFEERTVVDHGLTGAAVRNDPSLLRGRAAKVGLSPLVQRGAGEWNLFAAANVPLLFTIRDPAEMLLSQQLLARQIESHARQRARLFHTLATSYLIDAAYLAARWSAEGSRGSAPVCIDYELAFDDPRGYVDRIARAARLTPVPAAIAAAVANIAPGLYRNRRQEPAVRKSAQGVVALQAIYAILRSDDAGKWQRLRDALPAWTFDRLRQPDAILRSGRP